MKIKRQGFTLIELSIVLVVIGLIVGGVLVGRDLIAAAAVRAQIAQIEKYQTAVNTFRGKYGYLPGDIKNPDATQFGFLSRGRYAGEGDGNGILEGVNTDTAGNNSGIKGAMGENPMVWVDLSTAHLIDGNFNLGRPDRTLGWSSISSFTTPSINNLLPAAKLGSSNNYIGTFSLNGFNYFTLGIWDIESGFGDVFASIMLTVRQAYLIDTKTDDGFPQKGRAMAIFMSGPLVWSAKNATTGTLTDYGAEDPNLADVYGSSVSSVSPSDATCYDNDGGSGPMHYSVSWNNGMGVSCTLSFKFQ